MCDSHQCPNPPFACTINSTSDTNKETLTTHTTCKGLNGAITEWKDIMKSPAVGLTMITVADIDGNSNIVNHQSIQ